MIYEWCDKCNGRGSFDCSCTCPNCAGKGNVQQTCSTCRGRGRITCLTCSGSGRVLVSKSWFFGEKYGNCPKCDGARQLQCKECKNGSVQASCSTCNGTGGKTKCPKCGGEKKIACSSCGGKGEVRPQWSKERIREEIAERRRRIAEIEEDFRTFDELCKSNRHIEYPNHLYTGLENCKQEIRELMSWL